MKTLSCYKASLMLMVIWIACGGYAAHAYDVAPRISDREIIESLTELKQGHQALNQRIDDLSHSIDQRFETLERKMDQRFDDMNQIMNQRFDDMNKIMDQRFLAIDQRFTLMDQRFTSMEQRFVSMEQRFESMDRRFNEMHNMIMTMFGSVMALIIALIGFMIWDRRAVQKPLKAKLADVEDALDLKNPSGPNVSRLITVLRKQAETDENLAGLLRSCSLL